jgi:hypothetical protein
MPRGAAVGDSGPTSALPLLSTAEVASFVTHGFLRFDALVPAELCAAALAELNAGFHPTPLGAPADAPETRWLGRSLDDLPELWPGSRGIVPVLRSPRLAGVIHSLVGPGPRYDHHYAHVIPPRQRWSQPWHADAILDPRPHAFDIQLFFFFHDTPREAGGTMILPGSHLRRVNEFEIARYQNFRGQLATVCRAGTVLVAHHGIWHCGQPNLTDQPRTMFKLRLGPSRTQCRLWNTADLHAPAVIQTLRHTHPWTGTDARLEMVNRLRLWRALIGEPTFDIDYWLTRFETAP